MSVEAIRPEPNSVDPTPRGALSRVGLLALFALLVAALVPGLKTAPSGLPWSAERGAPSSPANAASLGSTGDALLLETARRTLVPARFFEPPADGPDDAILPAVASGFALAARKAVRSDHAGANPPTVPGHAYDARGPPAA